MRLKSDDQSCIENILSKFTLKLSLRLIIIGILTLSGSIIYDSFIAGSVGKVSAQEIGQLAKYSKEVTVRIEGAVHGSGVIVQKDANLYTVLTAWHVIRDNGLDEEIAVYTSDGVSHRTSMRYANKIQDVDLATITFVSAKKYITAKIGVSGIVYYGDVVFVSGYPLSTPAVPAREFRFLPGMVIANAIARIPDGYNLLYTSPTLPGISGGGVFNDSGGLIGIHGQGEVDTQMTENLDVAVKTGSNQGVPISYFNRKTKNDTVVNYDYYNVLSQVSYRKGDFAKALKYGALALGYRETSHLYFIMSRSYENLGMKDEAHDSYERGALLLKNEMAKNSSLRNLNCSKTVGNWSYTSMAHAMLMFSLCK